MIEVAGGTSLVPLSITSRDFSSVEINEIDPSDALYSGNDCEEKHRTLVCCKCAKNHKIQINCGNRLCRPCNLVRASRFRSRWAGPLAMLLKDTPPNKLKFLTLTLVSQEEIDVDRIKKCFQQLRDRKRYRKAWDGGIYDIETGYKNGKYTLHIHGAVKGDYISQADISKDWLKITGDSYIVDIRAVKYRDEQRYKANVNKVLGYLLKYITKPNENGVNSYDYNQAFGGRRLIQGWGCFYNITNPKPPFICPECGANDWEVLEYLGLPEDDNTPNYDVLNAIDGPKYTH